MAIDKTNPVGRFGCFKVLPLVFDEALSYYEVLCKLRNSLNEVIEQANSLVNELGLTDSEIDEIKTLVGEGSVDDRIYGAELSAKAYTDEVTEPLDARLDALEEGAEINILIAGGTNVVPSMSIITGDLTKGVKSLKVRDYAPNPTTTLLVPEDNHMYALSPWEPDSTDYVLRFWHTGHAQWKYVTVYLEKITSGWGIDASRSSVLTLN